MTARLILLAVIAHGSGTRYHATETYCTRNADTPANTLFSGRLVSAIYERAVTYPVWDRAGGGQSVSFLEFVNTDGALDSWLTEDWKDVRCTLKVVTRQSAYSSATQVGVAVIERIEASAAGTIRLVCRSVFERLEKVITTTYANTISNESLRDRPQPLTLGRVRWLDPYNRTLNDPAGSTRGVHDVADDHFESIVELRNRGGLATEVPDNLPTGTEYHVIADSATGYGYLYRGQEYRHAAEVRGQIRRGDNMITSPTFPTGTAGNPDNFDVIEGGTGTVTWNSAGSVTIVGDGTAATYITQDLTITTGQLYQLEISITSLSGTATLYVGDATLVAQRNIDSSAGVYVVTFTGDAAKNTVAFGFGASASGSATISAFRCRPVYRIASLAEVIRFAAVTRGTLSTGDLNQTALDAIDTARGYALAYHSQGGEVRGIDLVQQAAASMGCAIYADANGQLVPVAIAEPAVSADHELDELSILSIGYEVDEAPGLSTRMNYGRNYAPHSSDDLVLLPNTTTANNVLRAELAADVRTVATTATLHAIYAEAEDRAPLESLLSEDADAQAEIDRLCGLYTQARAFYSLTAFVDAATTHTISPGDTVAVTHSRFGLSAGKNLLVVAARSDFLGSSIDLVLWG